MKKSYFILITLIVLLFVAAGIQSVYAIDLNLINNVRENEINSAENLAVNTATNNSVGNDSNDTSYMPIRNSSTNESQSDFPSANISNVANTTDGTLTIGNILNILLVVVGVLLILLGIAIMIRMNR